MKSWGANSHGQLAIGLESEFCVPPQQVFSLPLNAKVIKDIKGGGGHVIVLENCGQLYSSGWNNRGQLGQANVDKQMIFSQFHWTFLMVNDYACGWDMSGAITQDSKAYVWGDQTASSN